MKPIFCMGVALSLWAGATGAAAGSADAPSNWGQWRGPLGSGVAPLADPPLEWSETNHVKWKTVIPGEGDCTPVVWGNKVFVLTAIPTGKKVEAKEAEAPPAGGPPPGGPGRNGPGPGGKPKAPTEVLQFTALCCDRRTGKILWQKVAREEVPHEGHHPDHGFASASPATDGEVVLAYFGSRGLYCYDLNGNLKWSKDLGKQTIRAGFGEGATPALYQNTVVLCRDDETSDNYLVAFDKLTGKELWRTPRHQGTGWSTPLVTEAGGKPQVVVNGNQQVRGYDLATGKELWSCAGQSQNAIPSPVASSNTVFATSGFRGNALVAINPAATGDLTSSNGVRWSSPSKNTPYVPSPLLVDDLLYTITLNNAVLSCFDARTGTAYYEGQRLEGLPSGIYASPVAAKDRVYLLGRDGGCLVIKKGAQFEVLARNKVSDKGAASLALAGSDLFLRTRQHLYCISGK
jgi:outer membrane protein assembly factor BamB